MKHIKKTLTPSEITAVAKDEFRKALHHADEATVRARVKEMFGAVVDRTISEAVGIDMRWGQPELNHHDRGLIQQGIKSAAKDAFSEWFAEELKKNPPKLTAKLVRDIHGLWRDAFYRAAEQAIVAHAQDAAYDLVKAAVNSEGVLDEALIDKFLDERGLQAEV